MASEADSIWPSSLARATAPNVPMIGIPKVLAHFLASASSTTARAPGFDVAKVRTADSPIPSPHSRTLGEIDPTATRVPHRPSMALRAGSAGSAASSSRATGSGTRTSRASWLMIWRWPALARVMTGEALVIQTLFLSGFGEDLVGIVLEWGNVKTAEGFDERAARNARDLGGTSL